MPATVTALTFLSRSLVTATGVIPSITTISESLTSAGQEPGSTTSSIPSISTTSKSSSSESHAPDASTSHLLSTVRTSESLTSTSHISNYTTSSVSPEKMTKLFTSAAQTPNSTTYVTPTIAEFSTPSVQAPDATDSVASFTANSSTFGS